MRESLVETSREADLERGKNLESPCDFGGFLEHGGNGTVFFLAESNGVASSTFVYMAAHTVEKFNCFPDGRRSGGAFAGADNFERLELLALFLEDNDDVGGSASAEGYENEFHGAWSLVRIAVGIEGNGVARGADSYKFLIAGPFYSGGLHAEYLSTKWSQTED